jgi:4-hydroxy-tetrahydrodipicolinate synthase
MRAALADRLRGGVAPAVLTPLGSDGRLARADLERYAAAIAAQPISGLAVWAHTGRGPYLADADNDTALAAFRAAAGDLPLIAGVAPEQSAAEPAAVISSALRRAERAVAGGADGLMVFPPRPFAERPDRERLLTELHEAIAARFDQPLLLFYLHAEAGGYDYSLALLRSLLAIPTVIGIKSATLNAAMTCQDVIHLVHTEYPGKLAITGEDRMFGPSLMWGSDAALVGIASAAVSASTDLMATWTEGDASGFLGASARLDRLAVATFCPPMEGYVQRMLWIAEREGLISSAGANDPWAPSLPAGEREAVLQAYEAFRVASGDAVDGLSGRPEGAA